MNNAVTSSLSAVGAEIMKMLAIRPTLKTPPKYWKDFHGDDVDDQERLVDWLLEQVLLGRTPSEIAKDLDVEPIVVNRLIASKIKQEQLITMFAVGQNLAKAHILSHYESIIEALTKALREAKEPSLIQKIAETMSRFADLKPPDPKLLTSTLSNEQNPEIIEKFRLLEETFGKKIACGTGEGESDPAVDATSPATAIPGGNPGVLSEEYLCDVRPLVLDVQP